MAPAVYKPISLDFTDCSGGVCSTEHPIRIKQNQVQPDTVGCMLKKSGFEKYPGSRGLTSSTTFTTYLRMLAMYKDLAGTERLLALSGGVLSSVGIADPGKGALTTLYDLTGTGEGWSCDSYGKKWVCNGSSVVKVESGTAYQVGITSPAGVTAAASAGAGLDDGEYSIYVSYGRRVDGVDKLYSSGQFVGTVTLGSGNNRITVSNFANSTDPQVGQKVVWVKSPGEVIHYFFYATDDNTTTSFTVSSDAAKNTSIVYEYAALDNGLPPAGEFIYAFANRIWILKDNVLWYSEKAFTEYDLEKFGAANYILFPYICTGVFSVGFSLYVNTESGIVIIPNADPNAATFLIEPRWHFAYMRTVANWNNGVIGVTNDGVRIFDGDKFSIFDMSLNIKNIVDTMYSSTTDFQPCGFVYKRSFRNEYHLMWRDAIFGVAMNNRHAILNLDSMYYADSVNNLFAWEFQPFTGNYSAVSYDSNTLYIGQSHVSASKIYEESKITDMSIDCYDRLGSLISTETPFYMLWKSKIEMPSIQAVLWLRNCHFLLQNQAKCQFRVTAIEGRYLKQTDIVEVSEALGEGGGTFIWDETNWDESFWAVENAQVIKKKIKELKGRSCYIEVMQTANDPLFKSLETVISGAIETGNHL